MSELLTKHTDLGFEDRQWLVALAKEIHVLADMSFSDILIWAPDIDTNIFWAVAQVRPSTGPTALNDDLVGERISYDAEHPVSEAYLSKEICQTSENSLEIGIPVDIWAIPVIRNEKCIAVIERHTNQMSVRAPGALEDTYIETANLLSIMLQHSEFPISPPTDPSISPRVGDGIIRIAPDGTIIYASPNAVSAYHGLGYSDDMEGENFKAITQPLAEDIKDVGQVLQTDLIGRKVSEIDLENDNASMRLRIIPLCYEGVSAGSIVLVKDTTEIRNRERKLVTKDATIREIHHRVKNNLQTVAALLRMQSRRLSSKEGREALRDAQRRVASIALVHEILSRSFDEDVVFDDIADRILQIVGDVAAPDGEVYARRDGSFGYIPAPIATSLSLIITELGQNAVEHGSKNNLARVTVIPKRHANNIEVSVLDEGKGLPENFNLTNTDSLGISIVQTIANDLGGSIELQNRIENNQIIGAEARVIIPLRKTRN